MRRFDINNDNFINRHNLNLILGNHIHQKLCTLVLVSIFYYKKFTLFHLLRPATTIFIYQNEKLTILEVEVKF